MNEKSQPAPPPLRIESIMTSDVKCVTLEMTVRDAIRFVTSLKISGAPVTDSLHKVVSVISEGDLLKLAAAVGLDKPIAHCLPRLPKTEKLITLKKTETFADAYKMFLSLPVHRIIVIDGNGKIQGLVTRSDVLRILVEPEAQTASTAQS